MTMQWLQDREIAIVACADTKPVKRSGKTALELAGDGFNADRKQAFAVAFQYSHRAGIQHQLAFNLQLSGQPALSCQQRFYIRQKMRAQLGAGNDGRNHVVNRARRHHRGRA